MECDSSEIAIILNHYSLLLKSEKSSIIGLSLGASFINHKIKRLLLKNIEVGFFAILDNDMLEHL